MNELEATRAKFEAWLDSPIGNTDLCVADTLNAHPSSDAWSAWLSCAAEKDKELAASQARVKDSEGIREATLKEAADSLERRCLTANEEGLIKDLKELKEKYDINEASNKAVELALEDVPYKGSYADGIEYLKETIEQLQREKATPDDFDIFGYIEPRKNFEQMEAESVYIVGEKDFDGCTVALYRRKE